MILKRIGVVALFVAFSAFACYAGADNDDTNKVMIKFTQDVAQSQIDSLTADLGLVKVKSFDEIRVDVFEIKSSYSVSEVVQLCSKTSFVEYAEPSQKARALAVESAPTASTQPAIAVQAQPAEYKENEIIVKFKARITQQSQGNLLSSVGIQIANRLDEIGALKCTITSGKSVLQSVEECRASADIEYAEPNYIYRTSIVPNDSRFSSLFGMTQIDAPEAWDIQTGSKSVIVGVIDTGVDSNHEDLAANIWNNPGETGDGKEDNGIDDDGNGFVDDYRGWDFVHNDNNPFDDNDHGSHVSGSVGAVGNNSTGVVGVSWAVSIMPLKFLEAGGSGTTSDAIEAIIYGTNNGAKILSNSWGGGGRSQALEDAISFANDNGVLFVAAAGNDFSNNDNSPTYPSNYEVPNVVSVAANTSSDDLAGFSNYGKTTVDLAAPGNNILSTVPGDRYDTFSGTSMATPHVSGAAALIWSQYPSLSLDQLIIRLLGGVDRNPNYRGRVATGGRLNVNRSLSTNPIIASTTQLDNTLDETGPYVVESDIIDDSGIQDATLTYQVTGQDAVTVSMTSTGSDHYRGEIPGQVLGATIVYFVSATDNSGNTTNDSNFTFQIAEPTGDGCCGQPAIDFKIGTGGVRTSVNAFLNVAFFMLPIVFFGIRRKGKK